MSKLLPVWIVLALLACGVMWAIINKINLAAVLLGQTGLNIRSSTKDEKLELFMPSQGHFKVMFPGKPDDIKDSAKMYLNIDLPGKQHYVADKEIEFHAAEAYGSQIPGGITATSPATIPTLSTTSLYTSIGTKLGKVASNNDAVGGIQQVDSPEIQAQAFIDNEAKRLTKYLGGTIISMNPVAGAGGRFPGREVRGSISKTGQQFKLREYWDYTNKRLFTAAAVGTGARVDSPQTTKFLDSMELWP